MATPRLTIFREDIFVDHSVYNFEPETVDIPTESVAARIHSLSTLAATSKSVENVIYRSTKKY